MLARSTSTFLSNTGARFESAIWTAKLMLLSVGVVSTFLLFKVALIPCIFESIVPRCLGCIRACLSPPYIYIILNFIIISIAASSSSSTEKSGGKFEEETSFVESQDAKESAQSECADTHMNVQNDVTSFFSTIADAGVGAEIEDSDAEEDVVVKHELTRSDPFPYKENCPPQAEDEEDDSYDDSLDGTWNAIMEGKGVVTKPFLRKSDTWNTTRAPPLVERVANSQKPQNSEMRKSETFNDRATILRGGGGVRRETLLTSQDSLNARVEAFINKFKNDMSMERQQSDMRYINMVKQQAAAT